jgi:hypothetical protein
LEIPSVNHTSTTHTPSHQYSTDHFRCCVLTDMIAIIHTTQHTSSLFLLVITCLVLQVYSFTPPVHLSLSFFSRVSNLTFRKQQQTSSLFTMMSSSSSSNRIVVVGSANQDLISNSDILPAIGETIMGMDFATACGGKGGNQAVAAALLQMTPVTMICRVGDDLFGQSLLKNFRE